VAGFIGSNFVYYYLEKYKDRTLIGLDKLTYAGNLDNLSNLTENQSKRFIFIKGDVNDRELLEKLFRKYDIDGIINFAAESHVDRSILESQSFIKTNILGTHTLLDISKKIWFKNSQWEKNKKFLQISTDEVYGSLGRKGFFTEKTSLDPHSLYSASKASADLIAKAYYDTYKMPINITRCSNNYGPFQFPEKLIPLMVNNAMNHKPLPVYGDGKHIRDWLHVHDHCEAINLIFEQGSPGEVYNVGGHNEQENISIVKKIITLLQEKTGDQEINDTLIQHVTDRLGHDRRYAIDASKIQQLGWNSNITFEEGLENTIQWYLDNKNWMEKVISGEYLKYYEKNYGSR
jgi:dTDP-glucose 4,6-dehydratase